MRAIWIVVFLSTLLFSSRVLESNWQKDYTLSEYLDDRNISISSSMGDKTKRYISSIKSGGKLYELMDGDVLLQSLIAINKSNQIHISRETSGTYTISIIPIISHTVQEIIGLDISGSLKEELDKKIHNPRLSSALGLLYNNRPFLRRMGSDTHIVFSYTQKERLGKPMSRPIVTSSIVKTKNKSYFAYLDKKGKKHRDLYKKVPYTVTEKRPYTYTTTKKIKAPFFRMPLSHPRVTSPFSLRRWHPILHKYKPHHGIDFGAKIGTPIYASNDGVVIYAGWMGGYGKVTKIKHGGSVVTLYAHQSKILVRNGAKVKRGQKIGKVGSTGRSTGPHLHFGLYLHNKPINPMRYIGKRGSKKPKIIKVKHTATKEYTVKRYKKVVDKYAKKIYNKLDKYDKTHHKHNFIWNSSSSNVIRINDIILDKKATKEITDG